MEEFFSFVLLAFTSVFFIVNPVGATTVLVVLTENWEASERTRVARKACTVAAGVLLVFLFTGGLIFQLFGITIGALRVAGGILLMRVALDMLHGKASSTKSTPEDRKEAIDKHDIAITPLAVPQLAGPGAIATVMLLSGAPKMWWKVAVMAVVIIASLTASYFILRSATTIQRILGQSGTRILTKLMGLIIATIAVQFCAYGVKDLLPLVVGG